MLQKFKNYDKGNGKKRSGFAMKLAVMVIAAAALTACAPKEKAEETTEPAKAAADNAVPRWRSLQLRLRMERSGQRLTPARYAMIQEEDTISRKEMFLCARTAETVFL